MYQELIEKLNPKPVFNLRWYNNEDLYSDGDVEDVIIKLIAENEPEDYTDSIAKNYCWPTYYHLTRVRHNILNWYNFEPNAHVLEIGCGFGAITNLLCDRCEKVTAVELSKRRATGALLRCRERENLEIIVGNLNDIEFDEKFDYITLIGVLEYQGSYTDTSNPYMDFLKKIKKLLKDDGKLLIAIENQYGLKYWCGAPEDHTGVPFDGINQYEISNRKVRTFSKNSLEKLVKNTGFKNTYFYYPMPDYKLPQVVYSEKYLPYSDNMFNLRPYYIPDTNTIVANELKIYEDVIENGVFEFFANSFLVECSDAQISERPIFSSLSYTRYPEYRVGTKITNQKDVIKFPLCGDLGIRHLEQTRQNEQEMTKSGVRILPSVMDENGNLKTEYVELPLLEEILKKAYENNDKETVYVIWDKVKADIDKSSEEAVWDENIMYAMDLEIAEDEYKYGRILKKGYLDMIVRNAFLDGEEIIWYDQEWDLECVPSGFVLYRALREFYASYGEKCGKVIPLSVLCARYGIVNCWNDYEKLDEAFINIVVDRLHFSEEWGFKGECDRDRVTSINKLLK